MPRGDHPATEDAVERTGASFEPLTPTAFLDRSAHVFRDRTAVVAGPHSYTYSELRDRCLRQAGFLRSLGVQPGDRVCVLAANGRLMLEAHYGVLYAGAVLVALNTRLASPELAAIIEHAECRVLLHSGDLAELARSAADLVEHDVVLVEDGEDYEAGLTDSSPVRTAVTDELALMALNYTSGTTGSPKGVMYHHRGAYLQALAMVHHFGLHSDSTYLWTLPMFHCNGWTFTWAVTAAGGTHLCLPEVEPAAVWLALRDAGVTHLCAAPTVLVMLANHETAAPLADRRVKVAVGGSPPSPALLERCSQLALDITHLYGLTETFGPAVICDWRSEWSGLGEAQQAVVRARQGVANILSGEVEVIAGDGTPVPHDGVSEGEVVLRGNNVMSGYFRDPEATAAAMAGGWFRTGDLGVMHPDGYLELRDRLKDVIVSGGENISSVEVERVLAAHPAVLEAAVVAAPDERWGERPHAWVTVKDGKSVTAEELRAFVRERLAGFKVPDRIHFDDLPKTASGKIRKVQLRELSAR